MKSETASKIPSADKSCALSNVIEASATETESSSTTKQCSLVNRRASPVCLFKFLFGKDLSSSRNTKQLRSKFEHEAKSQQLSSVVTSTTVDHARSFFPRLCRAFLCDLYVIIVLGRPRSLFLTIFAGCAVLNG